MLAGSSVRYVQLAAGGRHQAKLMQCLRMPGRPTGREGVSLCLGKLTRFQWTHAEASKLSVTADSMSCPEPFFWANPWSTHHFRFTPAVAGFCHGVPGRRCPREQFACAVTASRNTPPPSRAVVVGLASRPILHSQRPDWRACRDRPIASAESRARRELPVHRSRRIFEGNGVRSIRSQGDAVRDPGQESCRPSQDGGSGYR